MKQIGLFAAAMLFAVGIGSANADECSGHAHDTDTAVGAVGGAAVVGLASHSLAGAVVGGVVGGLAGNAIGRANDCDQHADRAQDSHNAYAAGREDQSAADADRSEQTQQQAYEQGRSDQAESDADRSEYPR